jgi:hypothetical protein
MKTITKTIKLYEFKELSEKAQEKVIYDTECNDLFFDDELKNVLENFEEVFNIKVTEWNIDNNYFRYQSNNYYEEVENLNGIRLLKYLINNFYNDLFKGKYYSKSYYKNNKFILKSRNSKIIKDNCCTLTGVYYDNDILKPIYDFIKNPNENISFSYLIEKCLYSWIESYKNNYENYYSKENIKELSEINNWYYLEDGKFYGCVEGDS